MPKPTFVEGVLHDIGAGFAATHLSKVGRSSPAGVRYTVFCSGTRDGSVVRPAARIPACVGGPPVERKNKGK